MSIKKWIKIIIFLLITVIATFGVKGVYTEAESETKPLENANPIIVEVNDDYFNPNNITLPNQETSTLVLKNVGKKEHTFTIEKLGIDVEI